MESADNNIEQQSFIQTSESREIDTKPSLYQILVYDGSHFQSGSVAFVTAKELSALVAEIEQTHSCYVQPLKFYSFNVHDREGKLMNIDPHAQLMTDFEVSQLRKGIDPLDLTAGEYRYDIREIPTSAVGKGFP